MTSLHYSCKNGIDENLHCYIFQDYNLDFYKFI
jgi:hypothetical protein